jgi:predicted RNA polymerase sigma factor
LGRELAVRDEIATVDAAEAVDAALDDEVGDDLLRLVIAACPSGVVARSAGGAHLAAPGRT